MENIAVFFDAENMPVKCVAEVFDWLDVKGTVIVRRAYADWSLKGETKSDWIELMTKYPFTMINCFHKKIKNVADNLIIMDLIKLVITNPEIDTVCIVSSDTDFVPLVLNLRESGKTVIGIGEKKKCEGTVLFISCNEFVYIEELGKKKEISLGDVAEGKELPKNKYGKIASLNKHNNNGLIGSDDKKYFFVFDSIKSKPELLQKGRECIFDVDSEPNPNGKTPAEKNGKATNVRFLVD